MKKFTYFVIAILASVSLSSCGASSSSCVSSEYQIKNIKFENQQVVLTDEYIQAEDKVN
ncbi:hypothetical protein [Namhaeicola litoreus]|uniref:Uncharacterized protein n=1 Tax=Namhaeicola litoreus TaxID=1052145 RepID=A0ABW3Y0Y2_9FLAO